MNIRHHVQNSLRTAAASTIVVALLATGGWSVPPPTVDPNQKSVSAANEADAPIYQFQHAMSSKGLHYIMATDADGAIVKLLIAADSENAILRVFGNMALKDPHPFFQTQTTSAGGVDAVQSVTLCQVLACESSPTGFAFVGTAEKKTGSQSITTITLKKLGRTFTVQIPNAHSGAAAPDPAILAKVQSLKEGDGVDIRLVKTTSPKAIPVLASIEPWLDPIDGEYQGPGDIEVSGVKLKGIKIKVGDEIKVLPWATVDASGKRIVHPALTAPKYQVGFPLRALIRHVGDTDEVRDVEYAGRLAVQNDLYVSFIAGDAQLFVWDSYGSIQISLQQLNDQDDASRFIRGVQQSTLTHAAYPELSPAQLSRLQQVGNAAQAPQTLTQADKEQIKALYGSYKRAGTFAERWEALQQFYFAIDVLNEGRRLHQAQLAAAGEQGLPADVVKSLIARGSAQDAEPAHGSANTPAAGSSLLGNSDGPPGFSGKP